MRSNLGRLRRTSSRSLVEQLATLTSVGDGSTLSLDFTTGVLDPRLTFTRLSNATFINSSGQVQYADANMVVNADLVGAGAGNTPTGWTGSTGINLTIPATGVRRAATTTAAQNWIQSGTFSTAQGLTYSSSVLVTEVSGQHYANTIGITGGATVVQYYRNGSTVGQFDTAVAGLVTVVWTATTTNTHNVRCGIGSTGANVANATCEVTQPRTIVGNIAQPAYFANSSTTAAYHAPRFDYDPTSIGTQRGLLIEGSANNLLFWSESFATSGAASNWAYNSNTGAVVTTDNPAGGTTAFQFAETANSGPLQQSATVTNVVHTFSAWFKGSVYNSVTTTQVQFGLFTTGFIAGTASIVSGAGSTSVAGNIVTLSGLSTTQWTRVQFTTSAAIPAGAVAILIYPQSTAFEVNRSFYIWGAQLELGSGASSYIPTGSSTGNRAADSCYMDGTNFSSWYNASTQTGTLFADITHSALSGANSGIELGAGLGNQSALNRVSLRRDAVIVDGVAALTVSPTGASQRFKTAIAFAPGTGNTAACRNGGTVSNPAQAAGTLSGINALKLYVDSTLYSYGWIRQVKVWPTNLPNATLQSITTI